MSKTAKKALIVALIFLIGAIVWRWRCSEDSGEDSSASGQSDESTTVGGGTGESTTLNPLGRSGSTLSGRAAAAAALEGLGKSVIEGTVTDVDSGERVEGVDILFNRGKGEETATSDGGGKFRIELSSGLYRVRAIGDRLVSIAQPDVRAVPGDPLNIDVSVRRLATIAGRVVDHAGAGVGGATVHFVAETPADKALVKSGLLLDQVPSLDGGEFELDVLPKTKLFIEGRKGFLRRQVVVEKLEAGERRSGVVIELQRGVRVRGVVRSASGGPLAGAQVTLSVASERKAGQTIATDRNGRFVFKPMAPGALVLEATAAGYARSEPIRSVYRPGEEVDKSISLIPPKMIVGQVIDADGEPVEGARVRAGRGGSKLRPDEVYTDDEGHFEIDGVDDGPYWVGAVKGGYASAMKEGARVSGDDVELTLLPFGRIEGRVTGAAGTPAKDFVVEIVTIKTRGIAKPKASGKTTRFRDDKGAYALEKLEPGRYQLSIKSGSRPPVSLTVEVPPGGVGSGNAVLP